MREKWKCCLWDLYPLIFNRKLILLLSLKNFYWGGGGGGSSHSKVNMVYKPASYIRLWSVSCNYVKCHERTKKKWSNKVLWKVIYHETNIHIQMTTNYAGWTKWANICVLVHIHHLLMQHTIIIFYFKHTFYIQLNMILWGIYSGCWGTQWDDCIYCYIHLLPDNRH
jgi:hypothetical protein